ncbi:MAG: phosphoribosylformylglycinamidine synthase [Nanoarchaeota archaeon]|nr:phosphoribosylformylglycinamidine synthase [Nanoarchaeota archaeon]MBU1269991.1 phosphoribosylformylglycinamidine synthase [Nanoarchaeota archaeon]MBU1604413.1 phosphoribosylformylglycinamidine synthase [Nanoarchaeota archaeon]MBU2442589.1 phosphoribosylformylglycinamidine synthase [Nanoarchaeota archaeon]
MQGEIFRIEIDSKETSSEAKVLEKKFKGKEHSFALEISKVYTIQHSFFKEQIEKIAKVLHNPVVETFRLNSPFSKKFDWALELGFLPGVTDNVANTTADIIDDLFKTEIGRNKVFTSKVLFITGNLKREDVEFIARELINTLIKRFHIKSYEQYLQDKGMDYKVPKVALEQSADVTFVDLDVDNKELATLGKQGIIDPKTGLRRGPLALDLDYMNTIKDYYKNLGRKPTDIEIESIAQTWSEHCKHTIFAAQLDDIEEGIFSRYIKAATIKVRQELGKKDFCISVFKDNSGGIIFDDKFMISHKVETHNSPSALDPFGGAITGIVGVNRDTIGFGQGALPITNVYGFCFGRPEDKTVLYRGKNKTNPAILPKRILEGVVHGVNVGGNCSGIPTPNGFVYFDDSYKGKPLIFVGTIGLMPRILPNKKLSHEKNALPGDNIVVIGGRVGKDGIHGATFSSEALDEGSPATAVQIGDPITQKKLSDSLVKEARDKELYNSITDNGAGGLSCSVAEMAKECGGFIVDLEKVPLKYPGLQPWEIWISESQERMTLAVPDGKLAAFMELMSDRGVESAVIGKFNNSNKAIVCFEEKEIFNIDMDFLHDGLPQRKLVTKPYNYIKEEPKISVDNHQALFEKILGNHNNCSFEFISKQYDHEVQNNSVIKPLIGKGRVNGNASVIKPVFESKKGVVISQSLYPRLSEISCYDMAACAIDTAIRNCVAVGGDINHLALLDNFCWCSSDNPERLSQLKDSAKACYDYAVSYKTPFISGKDSMFNDFKGFDENDNKIKISVLPTLLISSIGIIDDVNQTTSMDLKIPEDLIYVIGQTKDECGGSEFYYAHGKIGGKTPKVDAKNARKLYEKMHFLNKKELFSSCASVGQGGILITLAKMAIAGSLGAKIDVQKIPNDNLPIEKILYSESQSRFIVTIDPENEKSFEKEMNGFVAARIGVVKEGTGFVINNGDENIIDTNVKHLERIYKERFEDY